MYSRISFIQVSPNEEQDGLVSWIQSYPLVALQSLCLCLIPFLREGDSLGTDLSANVLEVLNPAYNLTDFVEDGVYL